MLHFPYNLLQVSQSSYKSKRNPKVYNNATPTSVRSLCSFSYSAVVTLVFYVDIIEGRYHFPKSSLSNQNFLVPLVTISRLIDFLLISFI